MASSLPLNRSLDAVFDETRAQLKSTMKVQAGGLFVILMIQFWVPRWYMILALLVGVAGLGAGWHSLRVDPPRLDYMRYYTYFQVLGIIFTIVTGLYLWVSLAYYDGDCHKLENRSDACAPKALLGAAAVFAPVMLLCFAFGAIYAKRTENLSRLIGTGGHIFVDGDGEYAVAVAIGADQADHGASNDDQPSYQTPPSSGKQARGSGRETAPLASSEATSDDEEDD